MHRIGLIESLSLIWMFSDYPEDLSNEFGIAQ